MAEPLKVFFSAALVSRLASDLARVDAAFPARAFVRQASAGLERLELLQRAKQIAHALRDHLPAEYAQAVSVLLRSLGPAHASDELVGAGMAPFYYLPHTLFVAEYGLDEFELSLHAQYELTKRFTAESSIRAYIAKDPERTFAQLRLWAADEDPHVRRLVSEGTRPRLPWASRVQWLDDHPRCVLELLELLRSDPASLVRRSVANNLNDLSKDHPELVVETCRAWLGAAAAPTDTQAMVRHALRSLVKKGQRDALKLLGASGAPKVAIHSARLSGKRIRAGDQLRFSFTLQSTANRAQALVVDYAVHFVKANGTTRPKVFKLKRVKVAAHGAVQLAGKVSFVPMTTRRHYPGLHRIEVLVNGEAFPLGAFEVRAAAT